MIVWGPLSRLLAFMAAFGGCKVNHWFLADRYRRSPHRDGSSRPRYVGSRRITTYRGGFRARGTFSSIRGGPRGFSSSFRGSRGGFTSTYRGSSFSATRGVGSRFAPRRGMSDRGGISYGERSSYRGRGRGDIQHVARAPVSAIFIVTFNVSCRLNAMSLCCNEFFVYFHEYPQNIITASYYEFQVWLLCRVILELSTFLRNNSVTFIL